MEMFYCVEVRQQGNPVAEYNKVEASDALAAIDLVESYYGEPVKVEMDSIEDGSNRKHEVMTVNNWHGYTFEARLVRPQLNPQANR